MKIWTRVFLFIFIITAACKLLITDVLTNGEEVMLMYSEAICVNGHATLPIK